MKFTQDDIDAGYAIQSYAKGQIKIGGITYHCSLIVTPSGVLDDWRPENFNQLASDDLARLVELAPEIVILGTGAEHRFPHAKLAQPLIEHRIGLESMATSAACRTYNILRGEGRRVLAALFMI
ncbi:MAG: Mth938-like domain-containing protein [Chromatiales bacterium]|jgi:uncharacterized protein